jgi:hypothetical protein
MTFYLGFALKICTCVPRVIIIPKQSTSIEIKRISIQQLPVPTVHCQRQLIYQHELRMYVDRHLNFEPSLGETFIETVVLKTSLRHSTTVTSRLIGTCFMYVIVVSFLSIVFL